MDLLEYGNLTEEQRKIHALIAPRSGRQKAISVASITLATGIPDRRARAIVKELVEAKGFPIASCTSGFFVPETEAEIEEAVHQYLSWGFSLIKRAYGFKKNHRLQEILGQLQLEMQ